MIVDFKTGTHGMHQAISRNPWLAPIGQPSGAPGLSLVGPGGHKGCIKMRGTGPPCPSNPILRICLDYLGGKGLGLGSEGRWMGEGGWGEEEEEGGKDS